MFDSGTFDRVLGQMEADGAVRGAGADAVQLPLKQRRDKDEQKWMNDSPTTVGPDSLSATPDRYSELCATPQIGGTSFDHRHVLSCPAVPLGAPPGLDEARVVEGLPLEPPPLPLGGKGEETPSKVMLPNYWPRTMSIDSLEEALAEVRRDDATPVKVGTGAKASFWAGSMSTEIPDGLAEPRQVARVPDKSPMSSPAAKVTLWPRTLSGDDLAMFCDNGVANSALPPPPAILPPFMTLDAAPPPPPAQGACPSSESHVVSLASALPPEPEIGSPDLPTVGSRGHRLGTCKPCAFLHTKGCTNGKDCAFCHLCSRGEKKRRQREKWQQQQQVQQAAQQAAQQVAQQMQMFPPMLPMPGSPMGCCPPMMPAFPMPMAPMPMVPDPVAVQLSLAALSAGTH